MNRSLCRTGAVALVLFLCVGCTKTPDPVVVPESTFSEPSVVVLPTEPTDDTTTALTVVEDFVQSYYTFGGGDFDAVARFEEYSVHFTDKAKNRFAVVHPEDAKVETVTYQSEIQDLALFASAPRPDGSLQVTALLSVNTLFQDTPNTTNYLLLFELVPSNERFLIDDMPINEQLTYTNLAPAFQ